MVKLALWMPLLSLAAFAVTSPVQSSPDGRDLRSPDNHPESLSDKKEFIKSMASKGFAWVSGKAVQVINSFPQEVTDRVYADLENLGIARVVEDGTDNSNHANGMIEFEVGDLGSPDSGAKSSPDKKAVIKSIVSHHINKIASETTKLVDNAQEPLQLIVIDLVYVVLKHVDTLIEMGIAPTEHDSTQAPPFETFNSATELIKQMIASNFGIALTQAFHEAIPEGVMEKSSADSNGNDTREVEITATEAHSSSLMEEYHKIKLQWFVDLPPNSPDPLAERLTRWPSPNQNKDASHTYVHMHRARDADLFEDFCKDRLPDDEVYVPPQHQPINPEDEDDVVPDQHAAFGITKATQRQKEAAWKDLGLSGLMNRGPPIVKGKSAAGGSRMPR
ncbi:Anaphase-promoting complex subunit 13 [Colletotrichum sp. SAR11_240]|nr:Anaphase-promoting complex subunit 13 [Colletotrichum sp. SAR11_240]